MKGKVTGFKIFMGIFRSMFHGFLPFSPFFLTELCSFRYWLKDLFTLHNFATKVSLTIKNDDVTSDRRGMDSYGRLWAARGRLVGGSWANGLIRKIIVPRLIQLLV